MSVYISEIDTRGGPGNEFIEIVAPASTDISGYSLILYESDGTAGFGPVPLSSSQATVNGKDVYLFSIDDTPRGIQGEDGLVLVDDSGNPVQFLSFEGNTITATDGPAAGQQSQDIGTQSSDGSLQSDDGGATYYQQATPNPGTVPCYAPGTMIRTPDGPRAVDELRPGDLVETLDHGPQGVRWVRSDHHPLQKAEVEQKPVLIQAGALGTNLPARDLVVSPQHRILVGAGGQLTKYFERAVFSPAKALTGLPGIRHLKGKTEITWVHFACDRHEVITANGCSSESLLLGPIVLKGLTHGELRVLTDIYGPTSSGDEFLSGTAARACLTVSEVRRRLAKCKQDTKWRIATEVSEWGVDLAMESWEADCLREAVKLGNALRAST